MLVKLCKVSKTMQEPQRTFKATSKRKPGLELFKTSWAMLPSVMTAIAGLFVAIGGVSVAGVRHQSEFNLSNVKPSAKPNTLAPASDVAAARFAGWIYVGKTPVRGTPGSGSLLDCRITSCSQIPAQGDTIVTSQQVTARSKPTSSSTENGLFQAGSRWIVNAVDIHPIDSNYAAVWVDALFP